MWGGDSASHDSETQNLDETVNELLNITQHVKQGLVGLPLYATIGNHDAYP